MVVVDNPAMRRSVSEILKDTKTCYNLKIVDNVSQALLILRREGEYADAPPPDIIFFDVDLQAKNGGELLKVIRETPNFKDIPLILISTPKTENDLFKGAVFQASGFITIPG